MNAEVPVLQLQPGRGLVGLPFGSSRRDVRKFFGAPPFSELSSIGCEADRWPGVAAHFSSNDRLQALELHSPCACMLDGTMISELEFEQAVTFLHKRDPGILPSPDEAYFPGLSMTVCWSRGGADGVSFVMDGRDSGDWWEGK